MARRGGAVGLLVLALAPGTVGGAAAATSRTPAVSSQTPIVIRGVGAAHGFGMAMDGVEGQGRAGWSHDQILSLFYPGTTTAQAGGTIRVGLAEASTVAIGVPAGGVVSDAPRGNAGTAGLPVPLSGGARITLRAADGGVAIESGIELPVSRPEARAQAHSRDRPPYRTSVAAQQEPGAGLLPTPSPPAPPQIEPSPTPTPEKADPTPERSTPGAPVDAPHVLRSVWVWGTGDPALVAVDATGHSYRGAIEIKPKDDKLVVVNHVDLETYVAGIAEEKGQAWPMAGLKSLAIAARSLGAATMSWYTKNTANGYDICPNANCQLYLGYDGEEPAMNQAVAETAGQIRTYNGRAILAMYHGNGGGQTESYSKAIGGGSDPHPYLRSVKYPFAAPSRWRQRTTLGKIESALRAKGIAVPGPLRDVEVIQRGESPRVLHLRVRGADGKVKVSGTQFATALGLRSTWFDFGSTDERTGFASSEVLPGTADEQSPVVQGVARDRWTLAAFLGVACLVALAAAMAFRAGAVPVAPEPLRRLVAGTRGGGVRIDPRRFLTGVRNLRFGPEWLWRPVRRPRLRRRDTSS